MWDCFIIFKKNGMENSLSTILETIQRETRILIITYFLRNIKFFLAYVFTRLSITVTNSGRVERQKNLFWPVYWFYGYRPKRMSQHHGRTLLRRTAALLITNRKQRKAGKNREPDTPSLTSFFQLCHTS